MSGPYLQRGGDLGERMYHALAQGLSRGSAVVLVGSDCPGLCEQYLAEAFSALEDADVVLGPAQDGGFVLIGCRQVRDGMLNGISWGRGEVLKQTLRQLATRGLSVALLTELYDVDTPADLQRWRLT